MNFQFDWTSFLIGLGTGLLGGFLIYRIRAASPQIATFFKGRIAAIRAQLSAGLDQYLGRLAYKKAQRAHLARQLFALEEILVPPRFLTHISINEPDDANPETNLSSQAIQFLPGFAEQASQYPYPSFSLVELLSAKANLFVLGKAGAGKTVALAHLASQIALKDPAVGALDGLLPVYLHVHELDLELEAADPLDVLISALSFQVPRILLNRLPRYLSGIAKDGTMILILDGLDELSPAAFKKAGMFLKNLVGKYPLVRLVTTAPLYCWDGLIPLGLTPVTIAGWNYDERSAFINHWIESWTAKIAPKTQDAHQPSDEIDPRLVSSWISPEPVNLSPLDWTLRLWSFYSNDSAGATSPALLEGLVSRLVGNSLPQVTLANLAADLILTGKTVFANEEVSSFLSRYTFATEDTTSLPPTAQPASRRSKEKGVTSNDRSLANLIGRGLLQEARPGFVAPIHPLILAYLAGLAFAEKASFSLSSPRAIPLYEDLAVRFLASNSAGLEVISQVQRANEAPFHECLFYLLDWLKDAPQNAEWRPGVLKQAVQVLQDQVTPDIVKQSLAGALALTNDAGVPVLFRQLLSSPVESLRRIVAISCGFMQDKKAIHELSRLLDEETPASRLAAALALGTIRDGLTQKICLTLLTEADESLRQAASESLAFRGSEGPEELKKAYQSENLLLRRAVVYGLAQIQADWAEKMLEKVAVEDGQWVVRSAAAHALEVIHRPSPYIPRPIPVASETAWLIAFASRQGVGIIPGKPANDLLIKVLESGTDDEQFAGLTYLGRNPDPDVLNGVYTVVNSEKGPIQEYAYRMLWSLILSSR